MCARVRREKYCVMEESGDCVVRLENGVILSTIIGLTDTQLRRYRKPINGIPHMH